MKKKHTVKSLKGKCWRLVSQYIKLRDCLRTTGTQDYGKCITCGKLVKRNIADAGHFISRRFNSTLFDETNIHLQCRFCNRFSNGSMLEYRRQIVKLYGEGYDIQLEDKATEVKKFTPEELEELMKCYQTKIRGLG